MPYTRKVVSLIFTYDRMVYSNVLIQLYMLKFLR